MTERRIEDWKLPLPSGGLLRGHVSYAAGPVSWAVVYVHGFGSTRHGEKATALERACTRHGFPFAAFDFRGHGESTGTMGELHCAGLIEDLQVIVRSLAERGIKRLCLVGSSMGGWATAWFTVRHPDPVVACVLIAPALQFPRGFWARLDERQRADWKRTGRLQVKNEWLDTEVGYCLAEERDRYPLEALQREWRRPLLVMHGMRDDVVPYRDSLTFVEGIASGEIEIRLYRDGDHRLMTRADEMAEAACTFFARHAGRCLL